MLLVPPHLAVAHISSQAVIACVNNGGTTFMTCYTGTDVNSQEEVEKEEEEGTAEDLADQRWARARCAFLLTQTPVLSALCKGIVTCRRLHTPSTAQDTRQTCWLKHAPFAQQTNFILCFYVPLAASWFVSAVTRMKCCLHFASCAHSQLILVRNSCFPTSSEGCNFYTPLGKSGITVVSNKK